MNSTTARRFVFLAGLLTLVVLIYAPGIKGPFVFDDSINIVTNEAVHMSDLNMGSLVRAVVTDEGSIVDRPLAMASFALNHLVSGLEPFGYKLTNIAIHLINAVLVYWLTFLVIDVFAGRDPGRVRLRAWIPLLGASIWALHPIQLTSVLYVVQRMTSLAALFVLAGLIVFVIGRRRLDQGRKHGFILMTAGIGGGTLLGVLSKENAALLILFALLLELAFFRFVTAVPASRRRLFLFYGIVVGLPLLAALVWLAFNPGYITNGYRWRDFTLSERLLTQSRVLWLYVSLFLVPDIRRYSLFYDDIEISTGLLTPVTTLIASIGLGVAILAALGAYRRVPWLFFGVMWFLAGHLIESTAIALELVHVHRNYLPTVGLALASAYGLAQLVSHLEQRRIAGALLFSLAAALAAVTASYASVWSDEESLAQFMVHYRPQSARAHVMLASARTASGTDPLATLALSRRAAELAPTETAYLIRAAELAARSVVRATDAQLNEEELLTNRLPAELSEYFVVRKHGGTSRLWLAPHLRQTIRSHLRDLPVKWNTHQTLISIAACATDATAACAPFYDDIVEWINLALQNPRIPFRAKRNLTLTLGTLYLDFGQLPALAALAESARRSDPNSVQLAIMHANVMYILGQRARAESILAAFANTHPELVAKSRTEMLRLTNSLTGRQ